MGMTGRRNLESGSLNPVTQSISGGDFGVPIVLCLVAGQPRGATWTSDLHLRPRKFVNLLAKASGKGYGCHAGGRSLRRAHTRNCSPSRSEDLLWTSKWKHAGI